MNAGSLAVIGAINVDLVVTGARLPVPGETVVGGTFAQHHGGKGGNQAVAASRAGTGAVAMIGSVGDDAFGAASLGALEEDGVDVDHVTRVDGSATGVALIAVNAAGENQITVAPGANETLSATRVVAALGKVAPSVVLVSLEVPLDAARAAGAWARERDVTLVLNPAPVGPGVAALLPFASVVTPNEGEASALGPPSSGDVIVQTRGAAGATIVRDGARVDVPAPTVRVVDTTGAGDCFNGVLAAALGEGRALRQAVERAVTAAALAVTVAGARAGMPSREALDRELAAG